MVPVVIALVLVCVFPSFVKWLVIGIFVSLVMNALGGRR